MTSENQNQVNRDEIDLVIFDCDGVLVDSELLSASVLMGMMEEIGLPISDDIFRQDFLGRSFASAAHKIRERFGQPMPDDFQLRYRQRLLARMRGRLQRMDGLEEVLSNMALPFCLATGSSPERLHVTMEEAQLYGHFQGRSFTASQVGHGKPAPDLFLLAAQTMGFRPSACLVIEDSEMGIRAARAAGMRVWHFAGGGHVKAGYRLPNDVVPDRVVKSMSELRLAFSELGIAR
jgi:HAD superfamily hydrolase (TIGR01509 family)